MEKRSTNITIIRANFEIVFPKESDLWFDEEVERDNGNDDLELKVEEEMEEWVDGAEEEEDDDDKEEEDDVFVIPSTSIFTWSNSKYLP